MSQTTEAPILLVEHEEERMVLIAGWLQDAGYDVLTCPGPSAPRYSCIGSRAGHCPLVDPASLVVLDLSFSPEATIQAPIDIGLLGFYLLTGKPIITLGRGDDLLADRLEDQLITLERTPDHGDFLETVGRVIARQGVLTDHTGRSRR
jgi:hypothetical protein